MALPESDHAKLGGTQLKKTSIRAACVLLGLACLGVTAAQAQEIDFSGDWRPIYHEDGQERIPGPDIGDYTGLPLNDAARLRADSYQSARISVVMEDICRQHGGDYSMRGLAPMRISRELDPGTGTGEPIAFRTRIGFFTMDRTIYLDGRPHPPADAPHTWQGFSTGEWVGNQLAIKTTHLKESYHRRNGVASGADRTFTERWVRHGDILTVVVMIEDPAFLTERLHHSQSWLLDPGQRITVDTCDYAPEIPAAAGTIPHYLPGQNPFLTEFADLTGISRKAARGGAETMYPEYRLQMEAATVKPERCTLYCTCMNQGAVCPVK